MIRRRQRRDDGGLDDGADGAWPYDGARIELPVEVVVVAWGVEEEYRRGNGALV